MNGGRCAIAPSLPQIKPDARGSEKPLMQIQFGEVETVLVSRVGSGWRERLTTCSHLMEFRQKYFSAAGRSLAHEIVPDNVESGWNRQPLVSVRPVAPIEHAVYPENVQNFIQSWAVEFKSQVLMRPPSTPRNTSDIFTKISAGSETPSCWRHQKPVPPVSVGGINCGRWSMTTRKCGIRSLTRTTSASNDDAWIGRVQNQIRIGEGFEVGQKFRPVEFPAGLLCPSP